MATWQEFEDAEPDLSAAVKGRFAAHKHKTMASVRADGAPRISGTEVEICGGRVWLGAMPDSRRIADLRRDPRLAIHSGSDEPEVWTGDAKVSGTGTLVTDEATKDWYRGELSEAPPGDFDLVEVDLAEVTLVQLSPDKGALLITTWRPGAPMRTVQRR